MLQIKINVAQNKYIHQSAVKYYLLFWGFLITALIESCYFVILSSNSAKSNLLLILVKIVLELDSMRQLPPSHENRYIGKCFEEKFELVKICTLIDNLVQYCILRCSCSTPNIPWQEVSTSALFAVLSRAGHEPSQSFTIMEMAPTRAFSWLKVSTFHI